MEKARLLIPKGPFRAEHIRPGGPYELSEGHPHAPRFEGARQDHGAVVNGLWKDPLSLVLLRPLAPSIRIENHLFTLGFQMIEYFTLILVCQLIGELAVTTMDIPFPGPVIGMVLLFAFLLINGSVPEQLGHVSSALLNNLSLLFVPAGVGVMLHLELLGTDLWPLSVAMVASTLLAIVVTALVMVFLKKLTSRNRTEEGEL